MFELALDLDEGDVGRVKPGGEDCRDVQRRRWIARKQSRCVGDTKLRTFEGPHVSCVWLVQQNRQLAEYRARFRNPGDLRSFPNDLDYTLPEEKQLSGSCASGDDHLSRFVRRDG